MPMVDGQGTAIDACFRVGVACLLQRGDELAMGFFAVESEMVDYSVATH
jgi:hypothetical protein